MLAKILKTFFTWDFIKKCLKFGVTSLSACVINFGVNIIGHECFGISVNILYPIALILVSISSFLQFRFFVFPDASKRNAVKQGWQFILSSIVFRLLEWTLFFILYNVVALSFHWWYVCCIVIVQTTGTISKFFFYNYSFSDMEMKSGRIIRKFSHDHPGSMSFAGCAAPASFLNANQPG